MKHFTYYPKIEYSDQLSVNIMVRGKIRDAILKKAAIYYDFIVPEGTRPDVLAAQYYGNSTYTWAIFYANNIFDPRFDWPLSTSEFNKYLKDKYGSVESAQNLLNEPHHYLLDGEYIIDKTTYMDTNIPLSRKRKVSNYEYELDLNNQKSKIKIIDNIYLKKLSNELENLFKS